MDVDAVNQSKAIAITGVGLVSPFGKPWNEAYETALTEPTEFSAWPENMYPATEHSRVGLTKEFPREKYYKPRKLKSLDKIMQMSGVAAAMALEDAQIDYPLNETSLFTATNRGEFTSVHQYVTELRDPNKKVANPGLYPKVARNISNGHIAITHGITGWSSHVASGTQSSLHALSRSFDCIRLGRAKSGLAGGFEAMSMVTLVFTRAMYRDHLEGAQPAFFSDGKGMIIPSDGSCFIALEEESLLSGGRESCRYAGLVDISYGQLVGADPVASYVKKINRFLDRNHVSINQIGAIVCSQSGGMMRHDVVEAQAIAQLTESMDEKPLCSAPRSAFGESESTAALIQVAVAASALRCGKLIPCFDESASLMPGLRIASATDNLMGDAEYVLVSHVSDRLGFTLALVRK